MEGTIDLLRFLLLRQIWPIVDRSCHSQNPLIHFSVTLKLITFTLTRKARDANSLLCIAIESELLKNIITGTNLSDIPEKYHILHGHHGSENYNAVLPPVAALRFSPHAENAFIDLRHRSFPDTHTN